MILLILFDSSEHLCLYRWSLSVETHEKLYDVDRDAQKNLPIRTMNNYFSIGADAKIALEFHEERQKNPGAFSSPYVNKIEYAKNFGDELFKKSCKNLANEISVFEVNFVSRSFYHANLAV